uniref:CASPASE_P20 domain-containing protein n=1 Tax=Macrostomum lignano TaxID=282301 RepID=A0A1I8FHS7_9PLAT
DPRGSDVDASSIENSFRRLGFDSTGTLAKLWLAKPKLFFIQACRGDNFDRGVEVTDGEDDTLVGPLPPAGVGVGSGAGISGPRSRVPLESDFFFFYSTPPGYFSWRNSHRGQLQLTLLLWIPGDRMELQHLMLMVQRLVSSAYASDTGDPKSTGMKQMPVTVSQLRKLLYFRP